MQAGRRGSSWQLVAAGFPNRSQHPGRRELVAITWSNLYFAMLNGFQKDGDRMREFSKEMFDRSIAQLQPREVLRTKLTRQPPNHVIVSGGKAAAPSSS